MLTISENCINCVGFIIGLFCIGSGLGADRESSSSSSAIVSSTVAFVVSCSSLSSVLTSVVVVVDWVVLSVVVRTGSK